jgi:hypothetical protein
MLFYAAFIALGSIHDHPVALNRERVFRTAATLDIFM